MAKEKYDYFNFPIVLLEDIFNKTKDTCQNIVYYAVYEHSLKLELGDELVRMEASAKKFDIIFNHIHIAYNNGKHLYNTIKQKTPITGISQKMVFDFCKNEKTEFEIASLVAFLGLKSILGTKDYCKTNKALLLSRMNGDAKANSILKSELNKYCLRYHFDRIITELKLNWGLKYYSRYTKGFYFSFDLELSELIEISERKKESNRIKQMKQNEIELRTKVLSKLNLTTK